MAGPQKIKPLKVLAQELAELKREGKRVVLCHGCFDLMHIGHVRYLQQAARLGDVLVVTVTPDRFVDKGPHRPVFPEALRAEAIAALDCVQYVGINQWPTAVETLELLRPTVYAKGAEYRENRTPEIIREETAVAAIGAEMAFIDELTSSSTELINRHFSPFPDSTTEYLARMTEEFGPQRILEHLERAGALRVLVIGETTVEEYNYCRALQRSASAPLLAMQYSSQERFLGAAAAVANHVAGFCERVHLLTALGTENSEEDWIRGQLRPEVEPAFLHIPGAPTMVRRRFMEAYFAQPMFEMYVMDDRPLAADLDACLQERIRELVGVCDLVIVADHGHGMLSDEAVALLCRKARFLAVSAQADAANYGHHTISKYPRASYACLAESEMRLEYRSPGAELPPLLADLGRRLQAERVTVTRGKHGAMIWSPEGGLHEAPSLATRVTDRAGGGDAFLALSAVCAALDTPPEVLAFLGNAAAAEVIAGMGGRRSLEKLPLQRHVQSLLR